MRINPFKQVLNTKPFTANMLNLATIILINRLHDQLDQQRRFAAQFFHINFQGIVGPVDRFPIMQKVRHLHREFYWLVGILDIKSVICPIFGNDREIALP